MEILSNSANRKKCEHLVLMFGLGLIGGAVKKALLTLGYRTEVQIAYGWGDPGQREEGLGIAEGFIDGVGPSAGRVSVFWSAGLTNFHSSDDDVEREHQAFEEVLGFAKKMMLGAATRSLDFHYVSSAGGLFEGQCIVNADSRPKPLRPYGRLKLSQEKELLQTVDGNALAIYRPSSVYGPMLGKSRQGLINNLVRNAQRGTSTTLDAHVMALRDYVFAGDIGDFIAKKIYAGGSGVFFLVSSRCSSIYEVVRKIERVLKTRLPVKYDEFFGNHTNITFSDKVLSADWHPTSLEAGIRQFMINHQT